MISRLRDGSPVESYDGQGGAIRFLYGTAPGRMLLRPLIRPRFSKFMGFLLSTRLSALAVKGFIQKNGIDMSDYPAKQYRSFNDFFTRTIRDGARKIDPEPAHLIAPCDSKLTAVQLTEDARFLIKGVEYTAQSLLRDDRLAEAFSGGTLLIFRLSVDDYHHYICPCDGVQGVPTVIPGVFHTVNPYAAGLRPIYRENTREYTCVQTAFGRLLQMEVGALMVGKITNLLGPGQVRRGQEKGYFEFGGSTVLLMAEQDMIRLDEDILRNSAAGEETVVKMGERIGICNEKRPGPLV